MSAPFNPYYQWLGIPPQEQPPNAYRLLGVRLFEQSPDVIATAADQRMLHLRTYQTVEHAAVAQSLLNEVAAARLCLLDPEKKAQYDNNLRLRMEAEQEASLGAAPVVVPSRGTLVPSRSASRVPLYALAGFGILAVLLVALAILQANRQPIASEQPQPTQPPQPQTDAAKPASDMAKPGAQGGPVGPTPQKSTQTAGANVGPGGFPPWAAGWPNPPAGQPILPGQPPPPPGPWGPGFPLPKSANAAPPPVAPAPSANLPAPSANLTDVVQQVEPSVVRIEANGRLGSGFVVDDRGLVVTNYHVIEGAPEATVTLADRRAVRVSGYAAVDPGRDLALLRVETVQKLKPIQLRRTLPRKGEKVAAFGSPQGFSGTVSQGIISAVRSGQEVRDVLRAAVGSDAYEWGGLDPGATWIQTTAPISPGNSGGPLIDMQGKVVAVNTWTSRNAQNLNFAIAASEISRLLREAAGTRQLASLPTAKPAPKAALPAVFSRIELPSGGVLTETMLTVPQSWQGMMFPKDASVYTPKYPNDEIRGVYTYETGKLDGWAAGLHEGGQLRFLAKYHESLRDGLLRRWDVNKQRLLYAEYARGNKNGLVCLFRDGMPWLIEEWKSGRMGGQYLVKWDEGSPSVVPRAALQGDDAKEFASAQKRLYELELAIDREETELKQELREWYREEEQAARWAKAAKMSVKRQQEMSKRIRARAAAGAAAARNAWQGALRRSGF